MHEEVLRRVGLLRDLDDHDLTQLAEACEPIELDRGQVLFHEGEPGDRAYLIVTGTIGIFKTTGGRQARLATREPGEVIGEMALLEPSARMATARADEASEVLAIPKSALDHLLASSPQAGRVLFETALARLRASQSQLRQSERMAQLGTMVAGIAHELNNPASATERVLAGLDVAITREIEARRRLDRLDLAPTEAAEVSRLMDGAEPPPPATIDPTTRDDHQSKLEEELARLGVDEPWLRAAELTDLGVTWAELASLGSTDDQRAAIAEAVAATGNVRALIGQAQRATTRVVDLVQALKSYSFFDRGELVEVDVNQGIADTLAIFAGKLKPIRVERDLAPDLPTISAHGGELNQVWTNLIDNAADALLDSATVDPHIVVRTRDDDGLIRVEVEDNGPGIAPDAAPHVFDQFFTTKAPGKGTGLGLDISRSIIEGHHGGALTFRSEPGRTVFRVDLPLEHT